MHPLKTALRDTYPAHPLDYAMIFWKDSADLALALTDNGDVYEIYLNAAREITMSKQQLDGSWTRLDDTEAEQLIAYLAGNLDTLNID